MPNSADFVADRSSELTEIKSRLDRLLRFLEIDAKNERLRSDAIDTAVRMGDLETAQRLFSEIPENERASSFWRFSQASLCIAQRRFGKAEQLLLQLEAEGEASSAITHNLAFIAFSENRYADCVAILSARLEQDDIKDGAAEPLLQTLWIRALHRTGEFDRALTWAQRAEDRGALSPTAKGVTALLAVDAGNFKKAAVFSAAALEVDRTLPEALVANASALLANRQPAAAKSLLLSALERQDDGRTWSTLGAAQLMEGKGAEAQESFTRAVEAMPQHIGSWHGLGWAYFVGDDLERAYGAFVHAESIDRNFAESQGALAVVAAIRGDKVAARQKITLALKLDSTSASARYAELILSGRAKDSAAVETLARALMFRMKF